jgi:hypothetical protein
MAFHPGSPIAHTGVPANPFFLIIYLSYCKECPFGGRQQQPQISQGTTLFIFQQFRQIKFLA